MSANHSEVVHLLSRGGWDIDDAQVRHRANPEKFWLPSPELLAQLKPGCHARLIFKVLDQAEPVRDGMEP